MSAKGTVDARVRRVTVLEDRAQVRREGAVSLPGGPVRLVVEGISPVLVDRSLVARLVSPEASARVLDARAVREWRIGKEERPADQAALLAEVEAAALEVDRLTSRRGVLEKTRTTLEQAADLLTEGIQRELPYSPAFREEWREQLASVEGRVRELDLSISAADGGLFEASSALAAAQARLAERARPDHVLATRVVVEVASDGPCEASLVLDYVVACALWRPSHRAQLSSPDGASPVVFACDATVWQRTGEDWEDVELLFSTARPTRRAEPPVLADDVLRVQRKVEKKVVVALRERVIATTGEGGAASGAELPGVDDGGETRLLPGASRATLRSDGRPRRVPLFSFESRPEVDLVARPERSGAVHLRSRQANASRYPLLAGPVELVAGTTSVGLTQVGFVAPGETFALGWGPEPGVRLSRQAHEQREAGILGKQTITRTIEVFASNLLDSAARFRLEERVPVSEIEAVTVEVSRKETVPPASPDDQGIVRWDLSLPPRGTQRVVLSYRLTAGADVKGL